MMAKGEIVKTKSQNLASSTKSATFSILYDATLAQKLSPSAKLLCYAITPTGELIADSASVSVNGTFANEVCQIISSLASVYIPKY